MKKYRIFYGFLVLFLLSFTFHSCDEDAVEDVIIPSIEPSQTDFNVDYNEGEVTIDFTSNVVFYANIEESSKNWLSYEFSNSVKTLTIKYLTNDTIVPREGIVKISKGDTELEITINQEGNPNADNGKLKKLDLQYSVNSSGGSTILSVPKAECDKIPTGATVVIECGDAGTISLLDAAYAEYVGGVPVNNTFSFVWTQQIANTTAEDGITTGILREGFEITAIYALYSKSNLEFSISNSGGYTILSVPADECAKIPIGATVVFECPTDAGTVSLLDATYAEFAGGSPVNGKFSFIWTQDIADITASVGITTGILRDGFDISSMYFNYVQTNLEFSISSGGGFTILSVLVEECAKIPIGATVVLECPSDAGTVSLLDATYTEFAGGSPVNGKFKFVWTKNIETTTATAGITTGILRDGFDITMMYCHN